MIYKFSLNIKIIAKEHNIPYKEPHFYLISSILSIFILFPYSFFMIIIFLQYDINRIVDTLNKQKDKFSERNNIKIEEPKTIRVVLSKDENNEKED